MNHARRGRAAEHRTRDVLRDQGFTVIRSAGSKGAIDLCAFDGDRVLLVQVKRGTARLSRTERTALLALARPTNAAIEVWTWKPRSREPLIERL
jgi:Holliday junction resolvase